MTDSASAAGRSLDTDTSVRHVDVAVIDSGVHAAHPHVAGVAGGVAITPSGMDDDFEDRLGHGTAVTAVIREKAPHARVFAVKVFDRALAGSVNSLVRAIDWSIERGCHVVNMSLGTARLEHEARLRRAVERAIERGVILTAALEDGGRRWLPGCLPGVVGVMVDWDCPRDRVRVTRAPNGDIICHASGYPRPIPGVPPARNLMGISFAVANTTGAIAAALARTGGDQPPDIGALLETEL
jgi:hypothetical protein